MTLILAFLAAHIGSLLIGLGSLAALITSFCMGHAKATAAAQPKIDAAQASATAATAALSAAANRIQADQSTAAIPDAGLDAALGKIGALRKD